MLIPYNKVGNKCIKLINSPTPKAGRERDGCSWCVLCVLERGGEEDFSCLTTCY